MGVLVNVTQTDEIISTCAGKGKLVFQRQKRLLEDQESQLKMQRLWSIMNANDQS